MLSLVALSWAAPGAAQSMTSGTITGTVRSSDFRPVGQALVSITAVGAGSAYSVTTTATGGFTVALVQPGSYEIRIEAIGYRPLVGRGLTIGGGETRALSFTLTIAPPPVSQVDTVTIAGAGSTRWRQGGMQLGGNEINGQPHRFDDLASVVSLSTAFDESLGVQGLPGDMTLVLADGVPFYRAPHPTARQELLPDAMFPRSTLAGVTAVHNAADAEWSGSAGGYVAVATRTSTGASGVELDGAYSGTPTWSSSELDIDKPSILSWQGGARGTVDISSSTRLVISGEALQQETPLAPRISESLSSELSGLDPALVTSLTDPGVERYNRYSGLVRLDMQKSRTSRLFFRGAGGFSQRDFTGAGPTSPVGRSALAEESAEFSAAFGAIAETSRSTTFEMRGGLSGSYRDFGAAVADVPPAYLTGPGVTLGDAPSARGESSRLDFVLIPMLRWAPSRARTDAFKFGVTIRASTHQMTHSRATLGDFMYSDPSGLVTGNGFGQVTSSPEASFGTQEYGAFAQYETKPVSNVTFRLGGRYDYELIGGGGVPVNADWLATTGIDNSALADTHHQLGLRGSLTWEPAAAGRTRVQVAASMHEGDVDTRVISAVYADATDATSARYAGTSLNWPTGGIPPLATPALPTLSLMGPDMRAPRTTNLEVNLLQRVGTGVSVLLRATTRRTDFLTRRRNLNVPLVPGALDPNGRRVYGTLNQQGSLVTTTTDDARRFSAFGEAWALDPDGWSEYMGLTGGIEYTGNALDLFGSYTYSETTDNWVGARSGEIGSALEPGLPIADGQSSWSEGTSDFDVPHRAVIGATARLGAFSLSGTYHFRSGMPFTPGYRRGVDANGDGSDRNDVAFVPDADQLGALANDWKCLSEQAGGFASRNSCRGPAVHSVNARLNVTFARIGGRQASLVLDGFNLVESSEGLVDNALHLIDPTGSITTSPDGATVTLPTQVNQGFGTVIYPSTRGRMLRIGVRIGG